MPGKSVVCLSPLGEAAVAHDELSLTLSPPKIPPSIDSPPIATVKTPVFPAIQLPSLPSLLSVSFLQDVTACSDECSIEWVWEVGRP